MFLIQYSVALESAKAGENLHCRTTSSPSTTSFTESGAPLATPVEPRSPKITRTPRAMIFLPIVTSRSFLGLSSSGGVFWEVVGGRRKNCLRQHKAGVDQISLAHLLN